MKSINLAIVPNLTNRESIFDLNFCVAAKIRLGKRTGTLIGISRNVFARRIV